MIELVVATRNKGKLKEIKELLQGLNLKITSLVDYRGLPKIEEDGKNLRENALKKAVTIARYTKKLTLGEDSGLEVAALNNQPGIYSARFAGLKATDKKNNAKLLKLLKKIPLKKRRARYRCCAALVDAKGIIDVKNGSCRGIIALGAKGKNGFGYDPLFFIPKYNKTFGELDPAIKAKMSHRFKALVKVRKSLAGYLQRLP